MKIKKTQLIKLTKKIKATIVTCKELDRQYEEIYKNIIKNNGYTEEEKEILDSLYIKRISETGYLNGLLFAKDVLC